MRRNSLLRRLGMISLAFCMLLSTLAAFPLPTTANSEDAYANPAIDPEANTYDFDENIILSIFWPPTPDYITDEQYQLIADAGVNWVMGAGEETLANPEMQAAMLELCAKYGLGMTVSDGSFGDAVKSQSAEEIAENVKKYEGVPGAYGFYIRDEPYNPNEYVKAYLSLKQANPDAYMHLNFLPGGAYGSQDVYYDQMNDWCVLCAEGGYPVDYLMFDHYPFLFPNVANYEAFMANLRTCHDVALKNNVRTGTYIQTVRIEGSYRRPTATEIRHEMYLALAFGYKQLSFFTWFTPVNRGAESFSDGIISPTGVPNAHYETIKTINHEILAIGSILAKCEAYEIYLNGETWGQPSIPEDFFAQPTDDKPYTVSFLRHKETGRNYLMVVNNNYSSSQSITLTLDDAITSLSEVSREDGSLIPLTMEGQNLTLDLAAGDAMLMALPEGYDHYVPEFTENPTPGTNLAALPEASVGATTSLGGNGWYIQNLTDGKRMSSEGWATSTREEGQITIDLGAVRQINRVDLFPTGTIADYGTDFPKNFSVLVSTDGESYTTVAEVTNFKVEDTGKSVTFDLTDARYVRITLPKAARSYSIAEIEVYHDDGSMPPMPSVLDVVALDEPVDYTEGDNIALKKPTYVSSTTPDATYKQWGWSQEYINDGNKGEGNGFTSNVGRNRTPNATEYVIIDFGDLFALEKVSITPCSAFPQNYQVQVSTDGKTWTDILSVTDAEIPTEDVVITLEDATVPARFLKFIGTKLRGGGTDGYLLQFREIEAYGAPICDKTALETAMAQYLAADGTGDTDQIYIDAQAGMADTTLTQTQANALTKALLAVISPEIPEDETNAPEEATDTEEATTEDVTEDIAEAVTEDVTEESTEAVTVAETTPETVADETNAPETKGETDSTPSSSSHETDTSTGEAQDTGCGSVITAGSAVLTAIAAAFVLRKKKAS